MEAKTGLPVALRLSEGLGVGAVQGSIGKCNADSEGLGVSIHCIAKRIYE